jgi:hypothetical protein
MAQAQLTSSRGPRSNRQLVILANDRGRALFSGAAPPGVTDEGLSRIERLLAKSGAQLVPILRRSAGGEGGRAEGPPGRSMAPARFFHVDGPSAELDDLRDELMQSPLIQAAYVKPPSDVPLINDMAPSPPVAPAATPDLTVSQLYLDPPPGGIGARIAWNEPGGAGQGVTIQDLEWAWQADHEDLQHKAGLRGGTPSGDTNHGTAVVGVIGANSNGFGVTGVAPAASLGWHAFSGISSQTIEDAAAASQPGDILLLEIHRAGPRFNFSARDDQQGYIAVEWWPDDRDAIMYAVGRGVIVVEAAGNGAEDLDDPLYDRPHPEFGPDWKNPFRRLPVDSGAILVGAGAPPPGTHGRDWGPDRSRLDFSNFGTAIDCQGWGREVTSCGYGDLQGGLDQRRWYTDQFSGTSSASPIVVGALACVQGFLRATGGRILTPADARAMLRQTGSSQQGAPSRPANQRIGNRPDIAMMMQWAKARAP